MHRRDRGYDKDSFLGQPFALLQSHVLFKPLTHLLHLKRWDSFTALGQASRKEHCSHLYQEVVYFLEQMESIGPVRRCKAQVEELKRLVGVDWAWSLQSMMAPCRGQIFEAIASALPHECGHMSFPCYT